MTMTGACQGAWFRKAVSKYLSNKASRVEVKVKESLGSSVFFSKGEKCKLYHVKLHFGETVVEAEGEAV